MENSSSLIQTVTECIFQGLTSRTDVVRRDVYVAWPLGITLISQTHISNLSKTVKNGLKSQAAEDFLCMVRLHSSKSD